MVTKKTTKQVVVDKLNDLKKEKIKEVARTVIRKKSDGGYKSLNSGGISNSQASE